MNNRWKIGIVLGFLSLVLSDLLIRINLSYLSDTVVLLGLRAIRQFDLIAGNLEVIVRFHGGG